MNRREKRLSERQQNKKRVRKIDWNKVYKQSKELVAVVLIFYILILSFFYYVVTDQNKTRKIVSFNPKITNAKVISISGKGNHAYYEFIINGKKVEGSTFYAYKGNVGSEICIEYSSVNPIYNLSCNEKNLQSIKEDVILYSFKILGILLIFLPAYILFEILIGNKRIIAEVSSKR